MPHIYDCSAQAAFSKLSFTIVGVVVRDFILGGFPLT